jgi:FKBP-type peptidyl-prolyl cis-trans isomerase 2
MSRAKKGDKVKVHYTGKLDDGTIFDSSEDRPPLEFTIGQGNIIPGFEKGVIGMESGDTKTVTIAPEEGYGPYREELTLDVRKGDLPENITPTLGQQLQIKQTDGNIVNVTISEMQEETVTLNANHPLAGKILTFDIELVEIL